MERSRVQGLLRDSKTSAGDSIDESGSPRGRQKIKTKHRRLVLDDSSSSSEEEFKNLLEYNKKERLLSHGKNVLCKDQQDVDDSDNDSENTVELLRPFKNPMVNRQSNLAVLGQGVTKVEGDKIPTCTNETLKSTALWEKESGRGMSPTLCAREEIMAHSLDDDDNSQNSAGSIEVRQRLQASLTNANTAIGNGYKKSATSTETNGTPKTDSILKRPDGEGDKFHFFLPPPLDSSSESDVEDESDGKGLSSAKVWADCGKGREDKALALRGHTSIEKDGPLCQNHIETPDNYVDLCSDTEDEESQQEVNGRTTKIVRNGLRVEQKSPKFNVLSRAFAKVAGRGRAEHTNDSISDIEDFSCDEDPCYRRPSPSSVSEQHSIQIGTNLMATPSVHNHSMAGNSKHTRGELTTIRREKAPRPWKNISQRPRLRDAIGSNPLFAASVAQAQTEENRAKLPLQRTSSNVWFKRRASPARNEEEMPATYRNDLLGGSGVGTGFFTFSKKQRGGAPRDSTEKNPKESKSRSNRKSQPRKTTRRRRRRTSKKQAKNWKGRTRNGCFSQTSAHRNTGRQQGAWGSNDNQWHTAPPSAKEDPVVGLVGGAEITF